MSEVTGLHQAESMDNSMSADRQAKLKKRYSTAPAKTSKTAKSVHLNPVPKKHTATSTGN